MWDHREIAKHNTRDSCWVIIKGHVWDVTDYVVDHPGGTEAILAWAGKDGTEEYEAVHPPGTIDKTLPAGKRLGPVAPSEEQEDDKNHSALETTRNGSVPLAYCLNLNDFERVAQTALSKRAWVYYSSASDDQRSFRLNIDDWARILFRPRVLINVVRVDTTCRILNERSRLPMFIAPAAMARLGHPDGELCLVKGAAHHQIGYAVSMASSVAPTVLMNCARELRGVLYYQLYVKKKRAQAEAIIKEAKELGFRALLVTVDTPVVGRREEDDRYRMEQGILSMDSVASSLTCNTDDDGRNDEDMVVPRGPYSSALDWDDLAWIRDAWGDRGPICLKGIATAEDAKIAAEAGIKSIYLSNHGGRQLDGSPSSLRTLLEIREYCPEVLEQCEVLLDGGVRRGSDVVKALCLGARAVGLGRPFLYALSAYGTPGVIKAIQILNDEIESTMRLLGVTSIEQLRPHMVNVEELRSHVVKNLNCFKAHI